MKTNRKSTKTSPVKAGGTTAANLAARFAAGAEVLDYFDVARARVSHGGARGGRRAPGG